MRSARRFLVGTVLLASVCACSPSASPGATSAGASTPAATALGEASPGSIPSTPASSFGLFGFDPESILGYYASLGYTCGAAQPSTQAAGYSYQSCLLVDSAGRTRVIGVVTDADDNVAEAFASVRGTAAETVLDPAAVLDPFAAFLGAMLGETRGESLLPWLAGHLGDTYAKTTLGELTVATYSQSADDHSKLYVEIATPGYLAAPFPSGAPAASS